MFIGKRTKKRPKKRETTEDQRSGGLLAGARTSVILTSGVPFWLLAILVAAFADCVPTKKEEEEEEINGPLLFVARCRRCGHFMNTFCHYEYNI
jgi:hypothetical protein